MKKLLMGWLLIIVLLSTFVVVAPVHATNGLFTDSQCECVTYVVNKLFGGPRSGYWPDATSMSTEAYWGNVNVVGNGKLRYRSKTAGINDVIIMQANAKVYVYNNKNRGWDTLNGVGYGHGHIGIVLAAKYYDKYRINGADVSGWYITMQSANWDNDNYYDNGSAWSVTNRWVTLNNCTNVNNSWIFVPNGPQVNFWR